MNKNAQLDFHPDAESLNAFAEQALGAGERDEIVKHLAVCGRCRDVVFLAQEAVVEMEPALAAAAAPRATAPRDPWYWNWRFAWVPVGAMAMVVTLAYVVHVRRAETGAEMAKVMNQAAPQAGTSASQPAAPPAQMQTAPQAEAAKGAQSRQRELKAKTRTEEAVQLALSTPAAAPSPAVPPPAAAQALTPAEVPRAEMNERAEFGSNQAAQAPSRPGSRYQTMGALAVQKQESADAALKKAQEPAATGEKDGVAARKMDKASADEGAKQAETDRLMAVAEPAASSEQVEVSPAPAAGRATSKVRTANGAFAVYKAKATGLPSGMAAVSTAAAQHSLLAVDKAGSVFLSEDAGSHWESVARQWNGRAVAVRTQALEKANASGAAGSSEAGFELVNDQGQVWASADGKTWKTK